MEKGPPPQYSPPGIAPPSGYQQPSTSVMACPPPRILGPHPQTIICPSCHAQVTTKVKAETSTKTHLIAALLCLVSCCCIPYCIDSCKSRNHYCPNCNSFLGAYNN